MCHNDGKHCLDKNEGREQGEDGRDAQGSATNEAVQAPVSRHRNIFVVNVLKTKSSLFVRTFRNIVAFYGMVIENDNVMIVMEMVPGGGLNDYLKNNQVSAQLCRAAF